MASDRIVLGTASLGLNGRDTAFAILDEFLRLGGTTIDTAAIYSDWVPGETRRSEGVIGAWLKERGNRDAVRIVTKGAHPLINSTESRVDAASVRADIDESLRRLGIDEIDLWLLHKHDPRADVAAIVGALQDAHKAGKIRAFGSSNWPVPRMNEALAIPGVTFSANQVLGNVFARMIAGPPDPTNLCIDAQMFWHAVDKGLELFLFSATAHGYFERRAAGRGPAPEYQLPAIDEAATQIEALAAEAGLRPSEMIIAALLQLSPLVRPIVGATSVEQLQQTWQGSTVTVPADTLRRLLAATGMEDFLSPA
jgi:aryl-alcohol dehydrogenase-like predicted oxidoreductase